MQRRDFLKLLGANCLAGCAPSAPPFPEGELLGVAHDLGHRLRDGALPAPTSTRRARVVIVGAGVAGLSAAWALRRAGVHDFVLLELEKESGGNARAGENAVSAYPWGAHYLPIPTMESKAVRVLLAELGVLQGDPFAQRPRYDERHLCHAPHERLFLNGRWQDGLMPQFGVSREDLAQIQQFDELIAHYRQRRDAHGRKAFALPMAHSAQDADLLALDTVSLRDFLWGKGLTAAPLHWYVDYCCRDDYGCTAAQTSAWAGLHYFCCRDGEASNASHESVLTWAEGNAWLTRRLAAPLGQRLHTRAAVFRVEEQARHIVLEVYHAGENRSERLTADHVIWAAPLFALPNILADCPADLASAIAQTSHAPWLTANLTLRQPPTDKGGAPLSWDNVLYGTSSLGYVVATHQRLRITPAPTVLTYYRALTEDTPAQGRQRLLHTPWRVWAEEILRELSVPHPDLAQHVQRIDVWRNGHAMIRPTVGFIWGDARARLLQTGRRLHLAHADLSGFSLFEEAQYRGIVAAERVMAQEGVRHASLVG